MKEFNHINVLSLIGVVINDDKLPMVIIPFMSKGDLKNVLRRENEVCWYFFVLLHWSSDDNRNANSVTQLNKYRYNLLLLPAHPW